MHALASPVSTVSSHGSADHADQPVGVLSPGRGAGASMLRPKGSGAHGRISLSRSFRSMAGFRSRTTARIAPDSWPPGRRRGVSR